MPVVRPELGPTLPEILGPRLRALPAIVRGVVYGIAALLLVVLLWALLVRPGDDVRGVVVREPVAYNYVYRAPMRRTASIAGVTSGVSGSGQSFTVRTLRLPAYRGDSSGTLPVFAERQLDAMAKRYPGFLLRYEGRANVNGAPGYELVFQYRDRGQTAYGRRVLLLPDPTARDGVDITMLSGRTVAVPRADAVGRNGALKTSLRSFRFGTERP